MQTSCIAHKKSIQPFVAQNVWPGTLKQQSYCAICLAHSHTYCQRWDFIAISLYESIYKEKHTNTSANQSRTIFTLFNFHAIYNLCVLTICKRYQRLAYFALYIIVFLCFKSFTEIFTQLPAFHSPLFFKVRQLYHFIGTPQYCFIESY